MATRTYARYANLTAGSGEFIVEVSYVAYDPATGATVAGGQRAINVTVQLSALTAGLGHDEIREAVADAIRSDLGETDATVEFLHCPGEH